MTELVVLVDENNNELGTMLKSEVHGADTPMHRAFSCFIFNSRSEVLLQQRSSKKKTWPLVWSNSVCGHPGVGESFEDAAVRRSDFELGVKGLVDLEMIIPKYVYQYVRYGVMEHEFCPVLVARFDGVVDSLNPDEVEAIQWMPWEEFIAELENDKVGDEGKWSEWCKDEVKLLQASEDFSTWVASLDD